MPHTVTFVTAMMQIYDAPCEGRTTEWRLSKFRDIAGTGIRLCVYTCDNVYEDVLNFAAQYENVRVVKWSTVENTQVGRWTNGVEYEYTLPGARNLSKDTAAYMTLQNTKVEFVNDATTQNPWNTTHFAWIDFSISYLFKESERTLEYLKFLGQCAYQEEPFLAVAGCTGPVGDLGRLLNGVVWRFCGGFLLGDAGSIVELYKMYQMHFPAFMRSHRRLVWEINFWAYLESHQGWKPLWYKADHNDTIVKIPVHLYSRILETHLTKTEYQYPQMEPFCPMQASHVVFDGKHYLNTRFVNYRVLDNGAYDIRHPQGIIMTQNVLSVLDAEADYAPIQFHKMREEETVLLPSKHAWTQGLEDLRIYVFNGRVRFIATNMNYSPTDRNSMVVGDYDVEGHGYANCRIIRSPHGDGRCEKNWIPVVHKGCCIPTPEEARCCIPTPEEARCCIPTPEEARCCIPTPEEAGEELFIYRWSPMEIGKIVRNTLDDGRQEDVLNIVQSYPIVAPNFEKVRGSTTFVEGENNDLVGLVHFSEELSPRRYYHMLVSLCKETLRPLKYSRVFGLQHVGIEFCTGFCIDTGKKGEGGEGGEEGGEGGEGEETKRRYRFWISKWDREPKMVTIDASQILLEYEF